MEHILIVDDEAGIRATLAEILRDEGYRTTVASNLEETRRHLERGFYDLAILDIWLPDGDGLDLLAEMRRDHPETPVLMISGHASIDTAVKALHQGAYDFLEKPLSLSRVVVTVQNALEHSRLARELRQLAERMDRSEILVGDSEVMQRLKQDLRTAAQSDSRILIAGENGTGKELVARQIHRLSRRRAKPFIEVNCAAIPEELIESELFGHLKGAFTGASADRRGRFEQADGGTLFLDEIADMSMKTQAKVLRALEEQRFQRVGGADLVEVDVRVLAATNRDLEQEIRLERFREDLFFRLAVIPIHVPALRERGEDVALLAQHFLDHFARELGRGPKRLAPEAVATLQAYPWPGNVRELRNVMERMMIMVDGAVIGPDNLPPGLRRARDRPAPADALAASYHEYASLRQAREAFESDFIRRKLQEHDGNVSRTAEALGIERSHLYRKLRGYGIAVERRDG
ncbi:MAG TPA: sigma-54 dependent transcriptional regulator [Thermoanaerobaculia bacterium]|nr:sigma-54 dependent transcriptional regulator [Thermoanaerobaculia bacterium]